jgi:hypothetical protein
MDVEEGMAAIRILYSLDVDCSALADISFKGFVFNLASGVFADHTPDFGENSRR